MEIPRNHGHIPNLKRNRFKFFHLGPTELSVPKLPLLPNPYFRAEIGNSDDVSQEISSRQQVAKLKIRPTPGPKVMGIGIFGPKNGAMPKIHYATPISRILLECFTAVGDSTVSWKCGPNSPSQSLVRARWNVGPKKENVGLKKIQWVEGNIVRLKFTQKNLAKHWSIQSIFFRLSY